MGGISLWQLLIVLVIIVLLFGTKKLRGLGSDLGSAVKGFKNAVNENDKDSDFEDDKDKPVNKVENKAEEATTQQQTEPEKTTGKD